MLPSQRQEDFTDTARCTPRSLDDIDLNVLVANDHFFVIDKPPDVRMDGQFDVTVEKLAMKALYTHPSADIHNLKWIHQLDFATSGVLCIGLTRAAAAAASSCFEHREVDKTYLAVLSGHLDVSKLPIAVYEPAQEGVLPKRRKLSPAPANACWQTEAKAINASALWTALHELDVTTLSAEVGKQVTDMLAVSFEEYSRSAKRRKQLRKLLADAGVEVETVSSSATLARDSGVDAPAPPVQKALEEAELDAVLQSLRGATPPCLFRAQGGEEKVIIRVPVAEVMGDFRMEPGHAGNPGKVSETELTVLGHAMYQGQRVTKVMLHPRTGRRHQLRIHCLALGHPIVGDYTYNRLHRKMVDDCVAPDADGLPLLAERMMLHAHHLRIPFPAAGKCKVVFKEELLAALTVNGSVGQPMVEAQAADPFPIVDGDLRPVLPACANG